MELLEYVHEREVRLTPKGFGIPSVLLGNLLAVRLGAGKKIACTLCSCKKWSI